MRRCSHADCRQSHLTEKFRYPHIWRLEERVTYRIILEKNGPIHRYPRIFIRTMTYCRWEGSRQVVVACLACYLPLLVGKELRLWCGIFAMEGWGGISQDFHFHTRAMETWRDSVKRFILQLFENSRTPVVTPFQDLHLSWWHRWQLATDAGGNLPPVSLTPVVNKDKHFHSACTLTV